MTGGVYAVGCQDCEGAGDLMTMFKREKEVLSATG